ncbi:MAG: hypothetical protein LW595_05105 [Rickettsiales bacterium]|nr:hypothetical protein [Rickettsiales bacterium]
MKKYTLLYIAIIYILYGLQVIINNEINPLYFDLSIYYNIFLIHEIFLGIAIINYIFKENATDN